MYTSRLPVSTSVRRPTRDADVSRSDMMHRPSNIPVTVRKANLFTPQTKRPFSMGASTANKSYIGSMTTDKKYQRPLKPVPDRDLQMKMFETLTDYIRTNAPNMPQPEAKKFFSSVSTTESTRIFEFLISRILPEFEVNRLETDVPEALSILEYPYIRSVTKSALVSVTTRQAAVGLLVIFYWLINTIKQIDNVVVSDNADETDPDYELLQNVLRYSEQDRAAANAQLFDDLNPSMNLESLTKENAEIIAEIETVKLDLQKSDDLIQEGQTIDEDISKCRDYILKMMEYHKVKEEEEANLKRESMKLEKMIEGREKLPDKLNFDIKNHEISENDLRRIKIRSDELNNEDSSVQEELKQSYIKREKLIAVATKLTDRFTSTIEERQEHLERLLVKDMKAEERQSADELAKVRSQIAELDRDEIQLEQQSEKILANLSKEEEVELQKLKQEESATLEIANLNMQHIESVLDRYSRMANNVTKATEEGAKKWREALMRAEQNARVMRAFSKVPKKLMLRS